MTVVQMSELFDLITDKFQSPYWTNDEKTVFLNRGQMMYVNELLPDTKEGINFERDSVVYKNISPLVYETSALSISSGVVTLSAVQTALNSAASATDPILYIAAVSVVKDDVAYPAKFTRHNDWYRVNRNVFAKGSTQEPRYRQFSNKFEFFPLDGAAKFTIIKTPLSMDIDGEINSELPDITHDNIVAYALALAGLGTKDQMLAAIKSA